MDESYTVLGRLEIEIMLSERQTSIICSTHKKEDKYKLITEGLQGLCRIECFKMTCQVPVSIRNCLEMQPQYDDSITIIKRFLRIKI